MPDERSRPADRTTGWRMPAETDRHAATWMAWPAGSYTLGDTPADADEARATWAAVANAVAGFEPVHVLVTAGERDEARRRLSAAVTLHVAPLDDAWYRDTGPTFVVGPEGLGAVRWVFNGWGQQDWARWDLDALAGDVAVDATGASRVASPLVNEGGGIHADGEGTVLATRTVQLDPFRNAGWDEPAVEAELARTLGARRVVWLDRGLTRDSDRYGTRGHVDLVAAFPSPGRALVHDQRDASHPDHAVSRDARARLAASVDAAGRTIETLPLPAPRTLRDGEGWVDWSYVNHYAVNGGLVACAFDDPADDEAADLLAAAYPGREVVRVDARPLFARGGGIHCLTQQQPEVP